jgi:small conductance mechanosensitive channel
LSGTASHLATVPKNCTRETKILALNLLELFDPVLGDVVKGVNTVHQSIPASLWETLKTDWHNDIIMMVEQRLPKFLVVLFFLAVAERLVKFFVDRMRRMAARDSFDPHRGGQVRTMASIVRATLLSILGFIAFLQFLKLLNINVAPLLASAGIIGVGIGLAAQSLFKDIINGIFIIVEDQYNVGETVKIASLTGTVEDLTLRLTRLRDGDGTLYIIPNSQIATVSNLSRDFAVASLSISVDASADPAHVLATLTEIANNVHSDATFKDAILGAPGVSGVDNINGRSLTYSIGGKVRIAQKDAVLRAFRNRIVERFKRERIPLGLDPTNMLLLAQQQAAPDPTATPTPQPIIHS